MQRLCMLNRKPQEGPGPNIVLWLIVCSIAVFLGLWLVFIDCGRLGAIFVCHQQALSR